MSITSSHVARGAEAVPARFDRAPPAPPRLPIATLPPEEREPQEAKPLSLRFWEGTPSWLTSGVFHLALILILSLLVVRNPAGQISLEVELGRGSGSPDGGEIDTASTAAFDTAPTESLDATELPVEALAPALELATADLSPAKLANAGSQGADGTGDGLGSGDGFSGEGEGFGLVPTKTQVFGLAEEAKSFVYVFDRSESMNSVLTYSSEGAVVFTITPLQAAKAELLRSLDDLDPRQRFQLVLYNHTTHRFMQHSMAFSLLPATKQNLQRARDFVLKTPGEGSTHHFDPLEYAIKLRPEVIYLMTDGEAKDDPTSAELAELRKLNRRQSRINVIHFCFLPRPESTLALLAKDNGGQFISVNISKLGPGMPDEDEAPPELRVMPVGPDAVGLP